MDTGQEAAKQFSSVKQVVMHFSGLGLREPHFFRLMT